jgi:hypothetical protein
MINRLYPNCGSTLLELCAAPRKFHVCFDKDTNRFRRGMPGFLDASLKLAHIDPQVACAGCFGPAFQVEDQARSVATEIERTVEFDAKTKCCSFAISFLLTEGRTPDQRVRPPRASLQDSLYFATVWNSRLQASQGQISRKCSKL